jgi:hypothetical protein
VPWQSDAACGDEDEEKVDEGGAEGDNMMNDLLKSLVLQHEYQARLPLAALHIQFMIAGPFIIRTETSKSFGVTGC